MRNVTGPRSNAACTGVSGVSTATILEMPAAPPDTLLQRLDRRVAALTASHPDLRDALGLQHAIIRTQLQVPRPPALGSFPLPRQQVVARVGDGVPVLHDQPVAVDVPFAADLLRRLQMALAPRFDALGDVTGGGRLDLDGLFAEAFVQHPDHVAEIARATGLEAGLLSALAALSVAPILRAYAARLAPVLGPAVGPVDDGAPDMAVWDRGYCPVCGGWPLLGELRGVDEAAWLRCAACGSGWAVRRPDCPYCGNADCESLTTIRFEGQQRFDLNVCERCTGYLKVAHTFEPAPAEVLALDDVASLQLDLAAAERGLQRPPGSGYRIELAMPDSEWLEELA